MWGLVADQVRTSFGEIIGLDKQAVIEVFREHGVVDIPYELEMMDFIFHEVYKKEKKDKA